MLHPMKANIVENTATDCFWRKAVRCLIAIRLEGISYAFRNFKIRKEEFVFLCIQGP